MVNDIVALTVTFILKIAIFNSVAASGISVSQTQLDFMSKGNNSFCTVINHSYFVCMILLRRPSFSVMVPCGDLDL